MDSNNAAALPSNVNFFTRSCPQVSERDRHLDLGYYEHAPTARIDYRNGFYFRDLTTKLGVLCRLKVPRTRGGFRSQFLRKSFLGDLS